MQRQAGVITLPQPLGSLPKVFWADGIAGTRCHGMAESRVRFPVGPQRRGYVWSGQVSGLFGHVGPLMSLPEIETPYKVFSGSSALERSEAYLARG